MFLYPEIMKNVWCNVLDKYKVVSQWDSGTFSGLEQWAMESRAVSVHYPGTIQEWKREEDRREKKGEMGER